MTSRDGRPLLEASGIRKAYGRRQVLRGADLEVRAGQLAAVVGENGAGKSTLLKILAGDLAADGGRVRLAGTLGYCPQDPVLDGSLTAEQHLRYFAAAHRLPSLDRAHEIATQLGYDRYLGQAAGTMSGGTRQKLSLTLALLHDPDVLLLDEPYQGFDWETAPDTTTQASEVAYRQFPVAVRLAVRDQARNRMAALLLAVFVPVWYLVMMALAGHASLRFRLFATGQTLSVEAGHLTLISAGLNALTLITGFAVFHAVHTTLTFDKRLVSAGYRQATLITAKTLATAILALSLAVYTALVLLAFWRPTPAGWLAITAGYAVMALTYGALGLLLGVLVKGDLEGFFLIIMGGLMDTFLQNPLGNPLANKPILEWFPSFGPMQFAVGGAFSHTLLPGHLALGFAWAASFTLLGLVIFTIRTRARVHPAPPA